MKKWTVVGLTLLLIIASTSLAIAYAQIESSPYICQRCDMVFSSEAALVNHMATKHDVDIQIKGEMPTRSTVSYTSNEYTPTQHYVCPVTGRSFYTEPEFVNWMESQ